MNWFLALPPGLQATVVLTAVAALLLPLGGHWQRLGLRSHWLGVLGAVAGAVPALSWTNPTVPLSPKLPSIVR